jgi:Mn-dependent DtxR family transcriptional regulator
MATAEEYIEAIESGDDPFSTASEVAERIGVTRQTAYKHLQRLYDQGRIRKKKIGSSAVIWWTSC